LAESITGSYSAVVGLPLPETERALNRFGLDTWRLRMDG
jgi:predicted house-cleaning NTP pyrophosphatase (Maf/HAM1 superfamily)